MDDRPPGLSWMWKLAILPGLLLILFTLPVTLPIVMVLEMRDQRRRRAASRVACGRCGAVLGPDAIGRAEAAVAERAAAWRRDHPGLRRRWVRRVWAVCGTCGAEYDYDRAARAFVLLDPGWSGQVRPGPGGTFADS